MMATVSEGHISLPHAVQRFDMSLARCIGAPQMLQKRCVAIALVVVAMDIEDGSVIVGSEEGKIMRIKIAAGQNQVYRLTGRISAVPKIL